MTTALNPLHRSASLDALAAASSTSWSSAGEWSGAGTALDAVTRGLTTGLVEQRDFASGTSSRSSKLDPRRAALPGDARLRAGPRGPRGARPAAHPAGAAPGAPGAVPLPADPPGWERPYVGAGLALYDAMAMAGKYDMGVPRHRHLIRRGALRLAPDLRPDALVGAIRYYDAQVDDARLTMMLARTAATHGAHVASRHPGGRLPARGRAGHRCPGRRPGDRSRDRGTGPGGGQRRRRLDQRHPGARRRPRVAQGPGQQGHPPRRAARPDPLRDRADPAHRDSPCCS